MKYYTVIFCALFGVPIEALAQDPAAANNALRKGNALYKKDDVAGAAKAYEEAANIAPKDPRVFHNSGNAQYRQKQYADAVAKYESAAATAEGAEAQARAYHNLGNAHLQQQKPGDAIKAYKEALKRNPNDEDTRYNMAFAQRMLRQQQEQQKKEQEKKDEEQA